MTEREPYTPTTEDIREDYSWYKHADGMDQGEAAAQFDRWLAAHDEAVRQEERERCARIVENAMTEVGYMPGPGETAVANPPIRRMSDVAARIRKQGKEQG